METDKLIRKSDYLIEYQGWKCIIKHNNYELWKTPTKFLVCSKYISYFRFYNTEADARKQFNMIV